MDSFAEGMPTKEFFVGILTRDIELSDAILDLLDNCIDGVVRQRGYERKRTEPDYYIGYNASITITPNIFTIEDNCGGIPRGDAQDHAFRMGRSSQKMDVGLPTVGIYGIGMKRAIFKIGRAAEVFTRNEGELYRVVIPDDWESIEDNWNFPINDMDDEKVLPVGGTKICITNFTRDIRDQWDTSIKVDAYTERLRKAIQQSYSFIIQKGFKIHVNGSKVPPLPIQLLFDSSTAENGIKPFLYSRKFDDVNVSLAIGFYAPPPSPEDIDDENNMKRSSADAGWTVVCNDRVVLYNDKSHLTGWGEAGVPQYHTQFVGIRGIVVFESDHPENLPMTTTKRGIDASSKIYAAVKDRMREGLKLFTDYTNRWKGQNTQERSYSSNAKSVSVESLIGNPGEVEKINSVKFQKTKNGDVYKPKLPSPPKDQRYCAIRYSKSADDVLLLTGYFFNDREHDVTPSQIGEMCFEVVLKEARQSVTKED